MASEGHKKSSSTLGAPAQHTQGSRKGKKAWRKHVDIEDIEESMEGMRAEERVVGSALQKKTDDELFQVDVKGDARVRKSLPRFSTSLLSSARILSQRSAVPAVFSRTSVNPLKRKTLSYEEKGRLLRIGKRPRRGPFNAIMDPTEMGSGSALLDVSEAAKNSGSYDVWNARGPVDTDSNDSTQVKHPKTPHPRSLIALAAVPSPHEGTSYNPLVTSHLDLLRTAHEIEERRLREAQQLEEVQAKVDAIRKARHDETETVGVALGMTVDVAPVDEAQEDAQDGEEARPVRHVPARKTKQERRKAERRKAEKRALAEKIARKRMLASVDSAKAMRKALGRTLAERERVRTERQQAEEERLKKGLGGQRLGKHRVPEGEVDVQLGEELSESLRALKPEGNLFRDRFLSMQQRALIEPRVPILPRKRKHKVKEVEKFAWKHFERE